MKQLLLFLLALAAPAAIAQSSCGATFPSWMLCDDSTQTLYVPNLGLTGGQTLTTGSIYGLEPQSSGPASWVVVPPGSPGPPNVLSIGTVTTGASGSKASATITGTSPSQVLNLTIPQGPVYNPGTAGSYTLTYNTTVLNSAQRICQVYTIQSAITVNNVLPVISPKVYPGDQFDWTTYVSGTDKISICVRNVSASSGTMPQTAFLMRTY